MARAPITQEAEALPEADRLEGFPHPRETADLLGHDAAQRTLAETFASGRMHHAWLIAGRAGIGKATLAYRLARHVLAKPEERDPAGQALDVPPTSTAARQVLALSHPGLLVLRRPYDAKAKRFAASIPVDEVRRLKSFLGLTAGDGAWRVVLVDSADELNLNAANALLKSLEEPPRRALFVLVSSQPSRLLPTVRSRCRRLDLQPLGPDDLRKAAEAALAAGETKAPSDAQWSKLTALADGSVRRALQLAAGGGLDLYEKVEAIFSGLPKVDWPAAHVLSDTLATSAQEQRYEAFFELLLDMMARLARASASGGGSELTLATRLIPEGRISRWAEAWEAIARDKADTDELNLDRKAHILLALKRLQAVAGA